MIIINVFNVNQIRLNSFVDACMRPSMVEGRMVVVYQNKNDFWTIEGKLDNADAFKHFCYLLHNMLCTDIDLTSTDNIFDETFEREDCKNTKVYVVKIILHQLPEGVNAKPLKYMFDFNSEQPSTFHDSRESINQIYSNQWTPRDINKSSSATKDKFITETLTNTPEKKYSGTVTASTVTVCNNGIIKHINTSLKGATVFINIDICDEKKEYYHVCMTVNKQDYSEGELTNQLQQLMVLYLDQRKVNVFADEFLLQIYDSFNENIVPVQLPGCVSFK